jgi:hypothetical protein
MPARSERVLIFPYESGQPGWIIRFPVWWNRSEFFKKFPHREINFENPIDANYVWVLNSAEATVWNEQCKEQFSHNPLYNEANVAECMHQLESYLRKASWVIVESYEWESGLD